MKKKLNCVLLIDDDEPTNFLSKLILEKADCAKHIHTVQSGQEALDYLTKSSSCQEQNCLYPNPDLILLDINMPAMNGWEFLERYTQLEKQHKGNIVMVMLTTSLNPDDKSKADSIPDISGFETKPLTEEKLYQILMKYFPEAVAPI